MNGINLYGPTYFQHILNQMVGEVKKNMGVMMYNMLLIITDGEIHDMEETKRIIVEASNLPLSIIIVGVGNEEFQMM